MTDVTPDTRDADLMGDVLAVLRDISVAGVKLFEKVVLVADSESFVRLTDGLRSMSAGVVGGVSQRQVGGDNAQATVARLSMEVVVRLPFPAEPAGDVQAGINELNRVLGSVRIALLTDQRRGGFADYIDFGGQVIQGTNIDDPPRRVLAAANQAFVAMALPVVCGYVV